MAKIGKTDRTILLLGATCGSRTTIGPTILARALKNRADDAAQPARLLGSPGVASVLGALSAGEVIWDKLPWVPARIAPQALAGRIAAGALVGATVAAVSGRSRVRAALLGGAAAAVAALVTYHARRLLAEEAHVPDGLIAVAEDALVVRAASEGGTAVRDAVARR